LHNAKDARLSQLFPATFLPAPDEAKKKRDSEPVADLSQHPSTAFLAGRRSNWNTT
jgi:hypothetical protein